MSIRTAAPAAVGARKVKNWSQPMRRRLAMARIWAAVGAGPARPSTITKSLPRPCILMNSNLVMAGRMVMLDLSSKNEH